MSSQKYRKSRNSFHMVKEIRQNIDSLTVRLHDFFRTKLHIEKKKKKKKHLSYRL